jgi:uncharacterized membrane protein YfcA
VAIGAIAGAMSGLLGVGGGFLMVPLQVMLAQTPQLKANANSLAAIVPISVAGIFVYYFAGRGGPQVDFRFALLLVVGGVVGAYVGARLASHVPEVWLGRVVAVVLAAVGLKEIVSP